MVRGKATYGGEEEAPALRETAPPHSPSARARAPSPPHSPPTHPPGCPLSPPSALLNPSEGEGKAGTSALAAQLSHLKKKCRKPPTPSYQTATAPAPARRRKVRVHRRERREGWVGELSGSWAGARARPGGAFRFFKRARSPPPPLTTHAPRLHPRRDRPRLQWKLRERGERVRSVDRDGGRMHLQSVRDVLPRGHGDGESLRRERRGQPEQRLKLARHPLEPRHFVRGPPAHRPAGRRRLARMPCHVPLRRSSPGGASNRSVGHDKARPLRASLTSLASLLWT